MKRLIAARLRHADRRCAPRCSLASQVRYRSRVEVRHTLSTR